MVFRTFSKIKIKVKLKPVVDNLVFRLHYRYTYMIFMASALLTTLYDSIGNKIDCMGGGSYKDVVDNYCFIMGTFTVDRLHGVKVGVDVPHPGVGPPLAEDDLTYHTYYQWVPFVLFVQGIVFYLPHWLWKSWEGGLFKEIIQDLSIRDYLGSNLGTYFKREDRFATMSEFLQVHMSDQRRWAWKFILCEVLNLAMVIGMLFFTDWFLGGEFLSYGTSVFEVAGLDPENRTDPMSYVFPRMAKCTFKSFGGSGTIQIRDVMCLIATNIINEKIYLFLWVWLVLLTTLTAIWMIYRCLTIVLPFFRRFILKVMVDDSLNEDITMVMQNATFSEWFLLVNLGTNMESSVFSEFIHFFAQDLAKRRFSNGVEMKTPDGYDGEGGHDDEGPQQYLTSRGE